MRWVGDVTGAAGVLASIIGIYVFLTGDMDAPWISKSDTAEVQQASIAGAAYRGAVVCLVADPTDAPLNVRAAPQGRLEVTLPDGVQVWRTNAAPDAREQDWAQIALSAGAEPAGWVLAEYLDCEDAN